jgi:hypothetical protein
MSDSLAHQGDELERALAFAVNKNRANDGTLYGRLTTEPDPADEPTGPNGPVGDDIPRTANGSHRAVDPAQGSGNAIGNGPGRDVLLDGLMKAVGLR